MNKANSKIIRNGRMQVLFLVGMVAGDRDLMKAVKKEAESFGDIIVMNLEDTYDNLPFKVNDFTFSEY